MSTKIAFRVRRAYDPPERQDGTRVLVDRLWPRGLSKERAAIDEWIKDVAPSNELRRWYGHDPRRYEEFARRYRAELKDPDHVAAMKHILDLARGGPVTLITATKDVDHSQAPVLARGLQDLAG